MGIYLRYDLIGQRPDENFAFKPEYHADFKTGGSCFSASTIQVPLHQGLAPMQWVQFMCHMTAQTPECAVRLRRYEWVQNAEGVWFTRDQYLAPLVPPVLNGPRSVGVYLTEMWHEPAPGGVYYALETRGTPVIYAAYIHGIARLSEASAPPPAPVDTSDIVAGLHLAASALSNIKG
jgi:hypothetical protein